MTEQATERVALITGGNSGVGFECARTLAQAGLRVVIASRNREVSARAVDGLRRGTGNPRVEEAGLDLASQASVRRFARDFRSRGLPLHVLICNAGLQFAGRLELTDEGIERTFAVNHLGHFLLTHLLLDRLIASAPARILVVSSGVHDPKLVTFMPKPWCPDFERLAKAKGAPFDGRLAYVNSKLCNLLFAYELYHRLEARGLGGGLGGGPKPVTVNAFEPGLVPGSGLARDYNPVAQFVWNRVLPVLTLLTRRVNTARRAGSALARLALDPALERVSGKYYPSHTRFAEAPSSDESYDAGRAEALWETSVRLCGLSPAESPLQRAAS